MSRKGLFAALVLAAAVAPAEPRKLLISSSGLNAGEFQQTNPLTEYFGWGSVTKIVAEAGTANVIWATNSTSVGNTTVRLCTGVCESYAGDSTILYSTHRNQAGGMIGAAVTAMMLDTTSSRRHLLLGVGAATDSAEGAVRLDLANSNAKTVLLGTAAADSSWHTAVAFVPGDDYAFVFATDSASDNLTLSICDYGTSAPCTLQQVGGSFVPPPNAPDVIPRCAYYHKATSTLYWGQESTNAFGETLWLMMSTVVDKTSTNFVQERRDRLSTTGYPAQCHLEADVAENKLYFSIGDVILQYPMDLAGSWFDAHATGRVQQWQPKFPNNEPPTVAQINGFALDDRSVDGAVTTTAAGAGGSVVTTAASGGGGSVATTAAAGGGGGGSVATTAAPVPDATPAPTFALRVTATLIGVTATQLKANLAGFRSAAAQVHAGKTADDVTVDEDSIIDVTTRRRLLADGVEVDYAIAGFASSAAASAAKTVQESAGTTLVDNLQSEGFDSVTGVTSEVEVVDTRDVDTPTTGAAANVVAGWTWAAALAAAAVLVVVQ